MLGRRAERVKGRHFVEMMMIVVRKHRAQIVLKRLEVIDNPDLIQFTSAYRYFDLPGMPMQFATGSRIAVEAVRSVKVLFDGQIIGTCGLSRLSASKSVRSFS